MGEPEEEAHSEWQPARREPEHCSATRRQRPERQRLRRYPGRATERSHPTNRAKRIDRNLHRRLRNNSNHHNNPGNFIVAPGVENGAHHTHDYVGNTTTNGFSTDGSLARGGTTCQNPADKSAYYWPVLRDLTRAGNDAKQAGGGLDENVGRILTPAGVTIEYRGNPTSKVVAMPDDLKIVTGDAKAVTNGPKNANAKWTCTGFENRTTTKDPLCPRGSHLERILDFPSCWDGKNTDSTDHRTHVVFPDRNGSCPTKFKAVAQLRYTLTYNQPSGRTFAVDTFPEDNHVALTDHGDFEAVMSRQLRNDITECINSAQNCTNTLTGPGHHRIDAHRNKDTTQR